MDTNNTTAPRNRHLAIKLATAAAIAALAMKIHAEVNINFSSTPFGTNLQSDGSAMDTSFTFELGTFTGGFVPTAVNTDQWAANWTPVVDSGGTTVPEAITSYGTTPSAFGDFDGFASEVTLDHNNAPFDIGSQGYVWGYDTLAGDGEWILLTNTDPGDEWTFGDTSGIAFSESWSVGSAGEAIIGAINFTGGGGADIAMQTGDVSLPPAVPEPSTTVVLTATALAFALRRRRTSC